MQGTVVWRARARGLKIQVVGEEGSEQQDPKALCAAESGQGNMVLSSRFLLGEEGQAQENGLVSFPLPTVPLTILPVVAQEGKLGLHYHREGTPALSQWHKKSQARLLSPPPVAGRGKQNQSDH